MPSLARLTISAKPDGFIAMFQRWTVKGQQSGLWTRIAMENSSIVRADEIVTAFVELERRFAGRGCGQT